MNPAPDAIDEEWTARALRIWFEHHPVDATFVGIHEHDARLPDLSSAGVDRTTSALRDLLTESPDEDASGHALDAIDRRIASGALRIRLWEYESRYMLGNPSLHAGDAVFSLMSLLLPNRAATEERVQALEARMAALPRFLEDARAQLDSAPPAWTRRALRECRGGLTFLREGLDHLDLDHLSGGPGSDRLTAARSVAATAIEGYASFLDEELLHRPSDRVGCGEEAFDRYLCDGHFLHRSADDVVAYARDELERTGSWLEDNAAEFGGSVPGAVTAQLSALHSSSEEYYASYDECWAAMKRVAEERRLVTWPDHPIRYVPRPAWARAAAPDLYFLFYRSPAAFDRPGVHDYLVAPLPDDDSDASMDAFLEAHNDSVIKLNHVVHHGGIGHHVQNWHAFRSPLHVGRVAAVDCSSRIAMFCGGTMAEGWACYATDLMGEAGALTPLEQYAEHAGRVRMSARAIVDVEVHHGRMTLQEAAKFYAETAGMSPAAAEAESTKNSMFPGAAMMYLIGTDTIHELRRDLMRLLADDFDLCAFHDAFLSWGSIPVQVVADELRRRARAGEPLGAHETLGVEP